MRRNVSLPIKVFCCYAQSDLIFYTELEKHLAGLINGGIIKISSDKDISPGMAWEQEIYTHIRSSRIVLLLISSDFLASNHCYSGEMTLALQRQRTGEAQVIPILLRPVVLANTPLDGSKMLPSDQLPITLWPNSDAAFENIAEGIHLIIDEIRGLQPHSYSQLPPSFQPSIHTHTPSSQNMMLLPLQASPRQFTVPELEKINKQETWKGSFSVFIAISSYIAMFVFMFNTEKNSFFWFPAFLCIILIIYCMTLYNKEKNALIRLKTGGRFKNQKELQTELKAMKKYKQYFTH